VLLQSSDRAVQWHGFAALAQATAEPGWEDRAFDVLAGAIADATHVPESLATSQSARWPSLPTSTDSAPSAIRNILVAAPARIDFAGGWTDTPPYSIERGGIVLNAAITLNGAHPVIAEATWLDQPRLVLASKDTNTSYEPQRVEEIRSYADPADPFALHKAAFVLSGLVPADADPAMPVQTLMRKRGHGLRLKTTTQIPRGSGLGTSSIMAGVVLVALREALAVGSLPLVMPESAFHDSQNDLTGLFDEVLYLEQMMTTGGGWQDQVGGLVGGVKLLTSGPGLPQRVAVEHVSLSESVQNDLHRRLLLIYTGQQRLAKDLLRQVMRRWLLREPEITRLLEEIARLAAAMRDALDSGALDIFGELLGEHWALNKRMHPHCTNEFIEDLFSAMAPYMCGAKLAGAGGGGFAIVLARDPDAARELESMLTFRYPHTPISIWPCAISESGLSVRVI
jgi:fucokinase